VTTRASIAIVGGGLSGLHAAGLLEREGLRDGVLIESRSAVGGRLLSLPAQPTPAVRGRFDLGATWYWPDMQPELGRLVTALGLGSFEQPDVGDLLIDRRGGAAATRTPGWRSEPASMRLAGGMGVLVDAIARRVDSTRILTSHRVTRMTCGTAGIEIAAAADSGGTVTFRASRVLLALPPRLAAATIVFDPELPDELRRQWADTATWMAPHAKYLAVYDEPFWRADGLCGAARSDVGPLVEIHDASAPGGDAALFGFVGVPADLRARVSQDTLRAHCRAQLVRLFGTRASAPKAEWLKDWAADPDTATAADQRAAHEHASAPASTPQTGPWRHRLFGIGSEWSPLFPGYVAGAVDAAVRGVAAAIGAPVRETSA
jgi:monoamine oxidase